MPAIEMEKHRAHVSQLLGSQPVPQVACSGLGAKQKVGRQTFNAPVALRPWHDNASGGSAGPANSPHKTHGYLQVFGYTRGSMIRTLCLPDQGRTGLLGNKKSSAKTPWSHLLPSRTRVAKNDSVSAMRRLALSQTTPRFSFRA